MVRKAIIAMTMAILLTLTATGCSSEGISEFRKEVKEATSSDIVGEYAFVETEYTLFINKKIAGAINQLTSRMTGVQLVLDGGIPAEDELIATADSIEIIEDCKESIEKLLPSTCSARIKKNVLSALEGALDTLQDYSKALIDGDPIQGYIEFMKEDINNLRANANMNYT